MTVSADQVRREVAELLEGLETAGRPYMIVGAMALDVYGRPRTTFDVDVQVSLDDVPPTYETTLFGCMIDERAHDEVFDQPTFVLHRPTGVVPFEVFVTRHWLPRQAMDHRVMRHVGMLDRDVPVPKAEDLVLLKLAYAAHASRPRRKALQDEIDIEGILATQGLASLDLDHLRRGAERLGSAERLESFLQGRD